MNEPKVSVVLCTRNRADQLGATLDCFTKIESHLQWELVVVNNGSTDRTEDVLREYAARARFPVKVVFEPIAGLSRARNTGWKSAGGGFVAFTDDDCYPQIDFVQRLIEKLTQPQVEYLGGRVMLFDPEDLPITIQTNPDRNAIPPHSFPVDGAMHGANMAARRYVLEKTNGFDEILGAGSRFPSAEDLDWLGRVSAAGFAGAYEPDVVVFHHHRRRTEQQVSILRRSYDLGRGAYYGKCFLDPLRRKQAARNWYWRMRFRLMHMLKQKRYLASMLYELRGTLGYLATRLRVQLR